LLSNYFSTVVVESVVFVGELPFEDDVSGSDNSVKCWNPYTKDVGQVVSNEVSNVSAWFSLICSFDISAIDIGATSNWQVVSY
jgi:hypothetical protein